MHGLRERRSSLRGELLNNSGGLQNLQIFAPKTKQASPLSMSPDCGSVQQGVASEAMKQPAAPAAGQSALVLPATMQAAGQAPFNTDIPEDPKMTNEDTVNAETAAGVIADALDKKKNAREDAKQDCKAKAKSKPKSKALAKAKAKAQPKAKASVKKVTKAKSAPKAKASPSSKKIKDREHYRSLTPAKRMLLRPTGCSKCRHKVGCTPSCFA